MHEIAPDLEQRAGRAVWCACRGAALAGGAVLFAMALVTVASVTGRALISVGLSPVPGDFELVELGCAIAVFLFLPLCQFERGHVRVDLVSERLPPRGHALLGSAGDAALAMCSGVMVWRMWLGFGEKFPHGGEMLRAALGMGPAPFFAETTFELQLPVWIPFGLAWLAAALFFVTCLYTSWRSLNWVLAGREPATP